MKKWTDDFISRCLDGLPKDKYRARAKAELTDHLLTLAQALEDAGNSPEEAQTRALELTGNPGALNQAYQAQFVRQQYKNPQYILQQFFRLALLTGLYYLFAMSFLSWIGFTYDAGSPDRICYPMYGHAERQYIYGAVIFLLPFSINAFHLRRTFRLHSHPGLMSTAGLLFTWSCEKLGLILINSMLGSNSLLEVMAGGWCDASPWFNFPYVVGSFLGCFVLGLLFSLRPSKP